MFLFNVKDISRSNLDKMLASSARLKKIQVDKYSGWADYCIILDTYVRSLIEHKKNFNLSNASDEQIHQLKLYDRDIWLISNYIKKIIMQFVDGLEAEINKRKQEDEAPKESEL